jgi:hypothetical protein
MATTSLADVSSFNAFIFNNADSQGTIGTLWHKEVTLNSITMGLTLLAAMDNL